MGKEGKATMGGYSEMMFWIPFYCRLYWYDVLVLKNLCRKWNNDVNNDDDEMRCRARYLRWDAVSGGHPCQIYGVVGTPTSCYPLLTWLMSCLLRWLIGGSFLWHGGSIILSRQFPFSVCAPQILPPHDAGMLVASLLCYTIPASSFVWSPCHIHW